LAARVRHGRHGAFERPGSAGSGRHPHVRHPRNHRPPHARVTDTTAQYTLHTSANAGGLLLLRAKIKASTGVPDININDLVTFCAIQALLAVPDVNVEFIDGKIHKHREVHMAFACDTPRGLMVPVVRDAHTLTPASFPSR